MVRIGIDIIEIERIEKALERHPRFLHRVFTSREKAYCCHKGRPGASLAARWAAKEAVFKVLGCGWAAGRWRDVEVLTDGPGRPRVVLYGRAADCARELGLVNLDLSLSHSREYALAIAVGVVGGEGHVFGDLGRDGRD